MRGYSSISAVITAWLLTACATGGVDKASAFDSVDVVFKSGDITYQGRVAEVAGVEEFLGVPFAQAPVGPLRWAAPVELDSRAHTASAQRFKPACMQGPHISNWYQGVIESFGGDASLFPTPQVSEDCLYLNIWRPNSDQQKDRPVFVFIHGGSNRGGWAYEPNYLGAKLAAKGAVVITIAYRLGVFGFFSHPELPHANFALLDQIAALRWIKQNAQALGGDPNSITVAGESAGASNIAYLLAAPSAQGLFQRAIHQSAGWASRGTQTKQALEPLGLEFAEFASGKDNASIDALRGLSAEQILAASDHVYADHYFDPVVDQNTVTQPLAKSAAQGELAKVDLLIGTNANEALMYLADDASVSSWLNAKSGEFGTARINAAKNFLSQLNLDSDRQRLDFLATSYDYTCPSFTLAQANAGTGGRTWFYNFTKVREGELAAQMGAYHGAELPYIFDSHDDWLPTNQSDKQLSEAIMQYWLSFARTGNPNLGMQNKLPDWPRYKQAGDQVQTLGSEVISARHPSAELCQILEQ